MTYCFDTSALAKLFVEEAGSRLATELSAIGPILVNRLAYPEARAALARAHAGRRLSPEVWEEARDALDDIWATTFVAELDEAVASTAGQLLDDAPGLRASDAVHLATALALGDELDAFVTWDHRLAGVAAELGIPVMPPPG